MHDIQPATAEELMRSRFEAFRRGDRSWLLATWHPSTRPVALDLSTNPAWLKLEIIDVVAGTPDDDTGMVEFAASYLAGGVTGVLWERSRFVRENGRWFYVDGVVRGD